MRLGLPCSAPCPFSAGERRADPRRDLDALDAAHDFFGRPPPSCRRSSSPTFVTRRTCSPRECSSRTASPGASKARFAATPRTSSPPRRPHPDRSWSPTGGAHDRAPPAAKRRLRAGRHAREHVSVRGRPGPPVRSRCIPSSRRRSRRRRRWPRRHKPRRRGPLPRRSCGEAARPPRSRLRVAQAGVRRVRRARRAARRDHARRAGEEARRLGLRAPEAHACSRRPLALPAQLDRLRSGVRLVARSRGPADARVRRQTRAVPLGRRRRQRGRRPGRARRTSRRSRGDARRAVAHAPGRRKRLHPARAAHLDGDPADDHGRLHRPARLHLEGRDRHEQPLCGPEPRRSSDSRSCAARCTARSPASSPRA